MEPDAVIQGERISLHGIGRLELSELLDLRTRNESFWEPFQPPAGVTLRPEVQPQLMDHLLRLWNDKNCFMFGVVDDGALLVGLATLEEVNWSPARLCCDIGFEIDQSHLRRGYATDTAHLLLGVAFNELSLHRVQAGVQANNTPSIALLEKLGFEFEGVAREWMYAGSGWADHRIYALIERDWRQRTGDTVAN